MSKLLRSLLSAITIMMFSLPCSANVIWQLNNFFFTDEATAVGQFEWDDVSNSLVAWDIDVLPTKNGSPGTYSNTTGTAGAFSNDPRIFLNFNEGIWDFRIGLAALDLLDTPVAALFASGNVSVGSGGFVECTNCGNVRAGVTGAYLSAVVPEPSTLALFALGLIGVGFARRRLPK